MATDSLIKRAHPGAPLMTSKLDRVLGQPVAFLVTTAILLVLFGWTFIVNPGRPAAADDPAYYTWRTEALLANDPVTLLEMDGPLSMFGGGYRVATPLLGAMIRRIADVGALAPTAVLAVGLRVLIPLLLAGFAYRWRRDPLLWHTVAFASASLLLTPPFAGYLDNMMALFFLSASLFLIAPSRGSWAARIAFAVLLLLAGLTHPTTLVIFCVVLGAMAGFRFLYRGFALRSVIRDDGAMLASAFTAAVVTYAIWKVGAWGQPAPLSEAALPPPAPAAFFKVRLSDWVAALRPPFNGPLFAIGALGLLASGRRAAENELSRVALLWLAPLVGIFGFIAGIAYPYYRFFNTTMAWVLLVGVGGFFVARYLIGVAHRGGVAVVALVGVVAVAFVIAGNFRAGFAQSHWNDVGDAWIRPDERRQLDALAPALSSITGERPVVFVVDDEASEPVRIYGFSKRAGNVTRYGVPPELQDRTAFYLGSVEGFVAGEATERDDYYRALSEASLADSERVSAGEEPVVVVVEAFNRTGRNAASFSGGPRLDVSGGSEVLYVDETGVDALQGDLDPEVTPAPASLPSRAVKIVIAAMLLLAPGWLALRSVLPDAGPSDSLGLVPALSAAILIPVAFAGLAITRSPLTGGLAWAFLAVGTAVGAGMFLWAGLRSARPVAGYTAAP